MSRRFGSEKVNQLIANVTSSGSLDVVIPAASGYIYSIKQIIASNQSNIESIAFYDGWDKITPSMTIGTSGTLFIDNFGGGDYELTRSSGLYAGLSTSGDIEVSVFYVSYDKRDPITKLEARAATLVPSVARGQG
jgi:hypothetical protein